MIIQLDSTAFVPFLGMKFHQYTTAESRYAAVTELKIPPSGQVSSSSACALACYQQICDEFTVSDEETTNICSLRFYNDTLGYTNTITNAARPEC